MFFSSMIASVNGSIGDGSCDGGGVNNTSVGNGAEKIPTVIFRSNRIQCSYLCTPYSPSLGMYFPHIS